MTKTLIASLGVLTVLAGCSGTKETCGPGTVNLNGICVSLDAGPLTSCGTGTTPVGGSCVAIQCSAGSVLVNGQCVAVDAGPSVACGPGTMLLAGLCVAIDAGPGLTCGPGTSDVNGQCVLIDAGVADAGAVDGGASDAGAVDGGIVDGGTDCSASTQATVWASMLQQPILPPRFYAGLDLANGNSWPGLTIDQAEAANGGLCAATPVASNIECPSGTGLCNTSAWGSSQQVLVSWHTDSRIIDQVVLQSGDPGYYGTLTATGPGGVNTYTIQIGAEIQKNGKPFPINWNANPLDSANNPNARSPSSTTR